MSEHQKVPVDLDMYIKKLANSRKRILLVNEILQNVQARKLILWGIATIHLVIKMFSI